MCKYKNGSIVTCCVTGIEKYGIFVSIDEHTSGLIHISEISDSYVRNPADYVSIGELIKARVIDTDDTFKLRLSIKDINYSINRREKSYIVETPSAFISLEKMLPIWIKNKETELLLKK